MLINTKSICTETIEIGDVIEVRDLQPGHIVFIELRICLVLYAKVHGTDLVDLYLLMNNKVETRYYNRHSAMYRLI